MMTEEETLRALQNFDGIGRTVLEARIRLLCGRVRVLSEENRQLNILLGRQKGDSGPDLA